MRTGVRRARLGVATWMALSAVTLTACSGPDAADGDATAAEARFDGATETLDGLGRLVLEALTRADTVTLASVRLTEQEHNEVVWPELPASRPEVNFPLDFAWTNIEMRDRRSVSRLVPLFDDLETGYRGVQCRGAVQTFATFRVLTDCWTLFDVVGRDGPFEAQLFKDVVVRGGGHKIFRYYDDLSRRYEPSGAD